MRRIEHLELPLRSERCLHLIWGPVKIQTDVTRPVELHSTWIADVLDLSWWSREQHGLEYANDRDLSRLGGYDVREIAEDAVKRKRIGKILWECSAPPTGSDLCKPSLVALSHGNSEAGRHPKNGLVAIPLGSPCSVGVCLHRPPNLSVWVPFCHPRRHGHHPRRVCEHRWTRRPWYEPQ